MTDPTPDASSAPHGPTPQHPRAPRSGSEKKDPLAFDRFDRWGLMFLLGVLALYSVYRGVVEPVLRWAANDGHRIQVQTAVTTPGLSLPLADGDAGRLEVVVPGRGTAAYLLELAPSLLVTVMVIVGCWLFVAVMRSVAAGDPFRPGNAARLRAIASFLVLGVPVSYFLQTSVDAWLLGTARVGDDVAAVQEWPFLWLVAGMVVAFLAEAFKAGSRLRDDVDGLV